MKGVLIIAHGSRRESTTKTMESIADMVRGQLLGCPVEAAYMEFNDKSISAAMESLVAQGVNEIVAAPYFLFEGVHIREDIPKALEDFCGGHPGVSVTLCGTLGTDPRLADILTQRIRERL